MRPLPYLTEDVPGIGGRLRTLPEDFEVKECPLYLPCGQGEHLYVRITKRMLATPQLVSYLSTRLGIKARSIGVAGLKDANSVSSQILSLQGVTPDRISTLKHEGILSVVVLGLHRNRLRTGHHAGNSFKIVVREANTEAAEIVTPILERLSRRGVPNYFGPQRQGRQGSNYEVGAALLRDGDRRGRMPKHRRVWYLNAYQSHVFNLVVEKRIQALDRVCVGDWAMKHENGACFLVQSADTEQPRAERFEISPTGPLFGSRAPWATDHPGEVERSVIAELGESIESLKEAATACRFRGERRPLRVPLKDLDWSLSGDRLTIMFTLPPGAYATSVLREIMKVDDSELR